MNYKMIFNTIGKVLVGAGILLLLPLIVAIVYLENSALHLLITALLTFGVGVILVKFFIKKGAK